MMKARLARWLRQLSMRLDKAHLVVVEQNKNSETITNYLAALASKKGFVSYVEYTKKVKTKQEGRLVKASVRK